MGGTQAPLSYVPANHPSLFNTILSFNLGGYIVFKFVSKEISWAEHEYMKIYEYINMHPRQLTL
jgi:hypothetical protein